MGFNSGLKGFKKTKTLTENVKFVKFVNPLKAVTVVDVDITVFRDVTPCSISRRYPHFIGTFFLPSEGHVEQSHQDLGVLLPKYITLLSNIILVKQLKTKMNPN
jgi:hypothetical protein